MQIGEQVQARVDVTEEGFSAPTRVHVHAREGERGEVVDVLGDGWVMVRWARTGTIAQCDVSELETV